MAPRRDRERPVDALRAVHLHREREVVAVDEKRQNSEREQRNGDCCRDSHAGIVASGASALGFTSVVLRSSTTNKAPSGVEPL